MAPLNALPLKDAYITHNILKEDGKKFNSSIFMLNSSDNMEQENNGFTNLSSNTFHATNSCKLKIEALLTDRQTK